MILRPIALLVLAVLVSACGSGRHLREPPPDAMHWRALKASCKVGSESVVCPKPALRAVIAGCIETDRRLQATTAKLYAVESLRGIDKAELDGTRAERDRARAARWKWGAIGMTAGAVLGSVVTAAIVL